MKDGSQRSSLLWINWSTMIWQWRCPAMTFQPSQRMYNMCVTMVLSRFGTCSGCSSSSFWICLINVSLYAFWLRFMMVWFEKICFLIYFIPIQLRDLVKHWFLNVNNKNDVKSYLPIVILLHLCWLILTASNKMQFYSTMTHKKDILVDLIIMDPKPQ